MSRFYGSLYSNEQLYVVSFVCQSVTYRHCSDTL